MAAQRSVCSVCRWWTVDQAVFSASEVWCLITFLGEQGHDAQRLIGAIQFEFDRLLNPSERLSLRHMAAFHAAARQAGEPSLALHLGRRLHLSTFGVPGFAVLSSATVGKALTTIVRFAPLLNLRFPISLSSDGRLTAIMERSGEVDQDAERLLFATDVVKLQTFLKDLLGPTFAPKRFTFCGSETTVEAAAGLPPGSQADGLEMELRAEYELETALLSRPLLQAHPATHLRAVEDCERVVEELRAKTDLRSAICARLRNLDVSVPTFAELSAELNMSERTLRRRLERLGTSYSRILDDLREDLAARLLITPGHTTEDVAERLGYSDAANFRHAFKRWTGEAPSHFRTKARSAPDDSHV